MADWHREINDFGRSLSRHLGRAKLTQRQFAAKAGILQQTLNKLCHQGSITEPRSIDVVRQWGDILGLTPGEIAELHLELALMRCPAVVKKALVDARAALADGATKPKPKAKPTR